MWKPRTLYDLELESAEMVLDCSVWGQDSVIEMSQLSAGRGSPLDRKSHVSSWTCVLDNSRAPPAMCKRFPQHCRLCCNASDSDCAFSADGEQRSFTVVVVSSTKPMLLMVVEMVLVGSRYREPVLSSSCTSKMSE